MNGQLLLYSVHRIHFTEAKVRTNQKLKKTYYFSYKSIFFQLLHLILISKKNYKISYQKTVFYMYRYGTYKMKTIIVTQHHKWTSWKFQQGTESKRAMGHTMARTMGRAMGPV